MKLNGELIGFVIVGALNTGFSYGIYAMCLYVGMGYVYASFVSMVLGIIFSFKTQGSLVFKNKNNNLIFAFILNWVLIYLCMIGLVSLYIKLGLNAYWAGIFAMPPLALMSFFTQKYIIFNRKSPASLLGLNSGELTPIFVAKNYKFLLRKLIVRNGFGVVNIGRHTYGIPRIYWWGEKANLNVGKYCSIANDVEILLGGNHRVDWVSSYPFPAFRQWKSNTPLADCCTSNGSVLIANDVWLGRGCVILSGVTIGNGAVVGANSLVASNIPDYAIVGGNPAKIIRMRFSEDQINKLNRIAWWNWSDEKVKSDVDQLLNSNVDLFISKYCLD